MERIETEEHSWYALAGPGVRFGALAVRPRVYPTELSASEALAEMRADQDARNGAWLASVRLFVCDSRESAEATDVASVVGRDGVLAMVAL